MLQRVVATVALITLPSVAVAGTHGGPALCTDTCATAKDGTCTDYDTCDYGTDCADCGPRLYALNPNLTLCDSPVPAADTHFTRDVGWRLGEAASPGAGLKRRGSCVPVECKVYPGCGADSCKDFPTCLPMGESDRSMSAGPDDYIFSFGRAVMDNQVGLMPDTRWWGKDIVPGVGGGSCNVKPEAQVPFTKRKAGIVWRGDVGSAGWNAFQRARGYDAIKAVREYFVANVSDDSNFDVDQAKPMTQAVMMGSRCIVYLEGNDCASSITWLFGTGSLIFAPRTLTSQCAYNIQPWKHYIPFDNDFNNMKGQVAKYCVDNLNVADDVPKPKQYEGPGTWQQWAPGAQPDEDLAELTNRKQKTLHALEYENSPVYSAIEGPLSVPDSRDASEVVTEILANSSILFNQVCNERREAMLKYHMLKVYKTSTVGKGTP